MITLNSHEIFLYIYGGIPVFPKTLSSILSPPLLTQTTGPVSGPVALHLSSQAAKAAAASPASMPEVTLKPCAEPPW